MRSEKKEAIEIAERALDRGDPDDDLAVLARQFLGALECGQGVPIDVVDVAFRLREMLALQTARRILTEMASHAKIGDDSYHDAVIATAESWCGMYK